MDRMIQPLKEQLIMSMVEIEESERRKASFEHHILKSGNLTDFIDNYALTLTRFKVDQSDNGSIAAISTLSG